MLIDLLALIVFLAIFGIIFAKWKITYWSRRGIYATPPSIPFGNARDVFFKREMFDFQIERLYNTVRAKNLKYGGYYFGLEPLLVVADLDVLQRITIQDFAHFTDHPSYVNRQVEPITANLFNLRGVEWREMRAKISPIFTSGKLKMMFHIALDCTRELLNVIEDHRLRGVPLVMKDVAARYSSDTVMACAFGVDGNCLKLPESDFNKYGKLFFSPGLKKYICRLLIMMYPRVLPIFHLNPIDKDFSAFFTRFITTLFKYREDNHIVRNDFIDLLLNLKHNRVHDGKKLGKKEGITEADMIAQAFLMWVGGYESASSTTAYCMYEIAKNEIIQERMRDEINAVLEANSGKVTYDALKQMTYMEQCIYETLRLYPSLPVQMRACTKAYRIPDTDVTLPVGMRVIIPVYGIQRDAQLFADPHTFDPDRFAPDNVKERHPMSWLAFGKGPRQCVGLRLGMMQTKMGLTVMLRNYKYKLNAKLSGPLTYQIGTPSLASKQEIALDVEKIDCK